MPEGSEAPLSGSANIGNANLNSRITKLETKVAALEKNKSGRLGSLALLFSFIATVLAIPSGFQAAKDALFPTKWDTGFRTIDPLTVTYDARSNQLQVEITTVALNDGKQQDTIYVQGAALGKQMSAPKENFMVEDPTPPFPVDPEGRKNVTVKARVFFDNPASAKPLAGDEQTLALSFMGLEGTVTHKICFPLKQEDVAKIISTGEPLKPLPSECREEGHP